MTRTIHIVDAFTNRPFCGNPAAVCIGDAPFDEAWMQRVAGEMNLSETAFLHPKGKVWSLRWFTPACEVKLCGHATLAGAFTLWQAGRLAPDAPACFDTLGGRLECRRDGEWIEMDFPAVKPVACEAPPDLVEALGVAPVWAGANGMDYLVEVEHAGKLRALRPDFHTLAGLPVRGVIVTCPSDRPDFDFESRFFAPAAGVNEDPVTGSAHCALGPYWQGRLGKDDFSAWQASARGGEVRVSVRGDRVVLRGQAVAMGRVEFFQ
jgi:PhzF family phenazine biosynthesis protein